MRPCRFQGCRKPVGWGTPRGQAAPSGSVLYKPVKGAESAIDSLDSKPRRVGLGAAMRAGSTHAAHTPDTVPRIRCTPACLGTMRPLSPNSEPWGGVALNPAACSSKACGKAEDWDCCGMAWRAGRPAPNQPS